LDNELAKNLARLMTTDQLPNTADMLLAS